MEAATHHVLTGEITTATRAIEYNGVKVEEGHIIGLLNDELTAANDTIEETLFTLLDQMDAEDLEIVTLYYGNGITTAAAEQSARRFARSIPIWKSRSSRADSLTITTSSAPNKNRP